MLDISGYFDSVLLTLYYAVPLVLIVLLCVCNNVENIVDNFVGKDFNNNITNMANFDPFPSLEQRNTKVSFRQPLSTPKPFRRNEIQDLEFNDDEFKPAKEVFNDSAAWALLEQFGSSKKKNEVSALARQSLYVNFDPLVKKKSPRTQVILKEPSPVEENDDLLIMTNTPPLNIKSSNAKRRLNTTVQNELDRMFICDAVGDSPPILAKTGEDNIVNVLKYTEADMQTIIADNQARILAKERDFELKEQEWNKKLQDADEKIAALKQTNLNLQNVVMEHERTVLQVISEKARSGSTKEGTLNEATKERDQAIEQLSTMTNAFSDLLKRYEKAKTAIETLKTNEEELKTCFNNSKKKIQKHEQRYEMLKNEALEKLEKANMEIEKVYKAKNAEIAKVETALKRANVQIKSLQASLEQKQNENKELTAICDELMKVAETGPSK